MPRLVRTPFTWLIYIQLGLYAYFLYGFGPVVSFLRDEQGISNFLASLHSTAIAIGAMAGGALFPWFSRRFGRERVMWASLALITVAVLAFVTVPSIYALTLTLTGVIAFGGMCVVSCVVVSLTHMHGPAGPSAISEANAMAVAAGLAAPLIIGWTVDIGWGWRAGVGVLVGFVAIVVLVAWRMRLFTSSVNEVSIVDSKEPKAPLPKAYWYAWTMMVMTGAVEIVLSLWTAIVLREEIGFSPAAAAAAVSAIIAGMLTGRTLGARLALRISPLRLYFAALIVSLAGFALFWVASAASTGGAIPAVIGLFVAGLGNAMHYPLAIALALAVAPGQADRAAGVASYGMGLSFGVGPLVLGLLADEIGAHNALLLVPFFLAAAALLAWWLRGSASAPELGNRPAEVIEQMA